MSLVVSTPQQICNSPMNSSKSKMLYSFPRANRMGNLKDDSNYHYYDVPNSRSTRSTSFGYGTKYDFTQGQAKTPAPNAYAVKGVIGVSRKTGFSFGLSREQMAVTGGMFIGDKKSPGPGAYDTREMNKTSIAFSFRPKTDLAEDAEAKKIPGPGTYDVLQTISPKGKLFVSKYKSSGATVINPAHSKRFPAQKEGEAPPPGTYNVGCEINSKGSYFVSKFKTSLGKTFGASLRNAKSADNLKQVPGPGSYKLPSDFGYYEAKTVQAKTTA